jgi:hypothetical protein
LDNLVGVQANPQRTENQPRLKNGFRIKCFSEDWQIACDFLQLFILRCAYAIFCCLAACTNIQLKK